MQTLLNTLYVGTQMSYLHLDNNTVRVEVERETRLRVPLHHLGGVVLFGNVLISPALIHRLADEGKSLVLLSEHGRFKARMEGPVSGNILLRQAQYARAGDPAFALAIARAVVAGKIKNTRQLLLRGGREAKDDDDRTRRQAYRPYPRSRYRRRSPGQPKLAECASQSADSAPA